MELLGLAASALSEWRHTVPGFFLVILLASPRNPGQQLNGFLYMDLLCNAQDEEPGELMWQLAAAPKAGKAGSPGLPGATRETEGKESGFGV